MRRNRSMSSAMLKTVIYSVGVLIISIDATHPEDEYRAYVQPVHVDVPTYQAGHHYEEEHHEKPNPYSFGYNMKDAHGNNQFHKEESDEHGTKRGSYGYTDAYGIYRHVEYIADALGFRAIVKTNEPGTARQNPSHVEMLAESPPTYHIGPEHHDVNNYNDVSHQNEHGYNTHQNLQS